MHLAGLLWDLLSCCFWSVGQRRWCGIWSASLWDLQAKITAKGLLPFMTVGTAPAMTHAKVSWVSVVSLLWKKGAGRSQLSREMSMKVTSSLTGQEHPTHKSYPWGLCWAWDWGQHSPHLSIKDWLLPSFSSFLSLCPRCWEDKEAIEKMEKNSSLWTSTPLALVCGPAGMSGRREQKDFGLSLPK